MSETRKPAPSEVGAGSSEGMCTCGHGMYSHYLCGADSARCLVKGCGCKTYNDTLWGRPVSKAESGAPPQTGASQPNPDGVSHENENFSQCKSYFHESRCLLSLYHAGRHRDRAGISAICWNDNEATEQTFTHSELTTLLERMARLVVEAAIRLAREEDEELRLNHISALLAPEKLQQLREAVERG